MVKISIVYLLVLPAFFAYIPQDEKPIKVNTEYLSWDSVKINGKLPLLCKKESLYQLLGKPDSVVTPDYENICVSFFARSKFKYTYWGNSLFEEYGSQIVISSIDVEKTNKIRLSAGNIFFDNTMTLERLARLYPRSVKEAQELIIDKKGKVLSVKLATAKEEGENAWIFHFRSGKLVQVDYWIPC
jgi:hypothetical protein